jgi:hypothetical protein
MRMDADLSTKILRLKLALLAGEVMTPLRAWDRWRMAFNTYHRSIHSLRHNRGLNIKSKLVKDETTGARHSIHWIEK